MRIQESLLSSSDLLDHHINLVSVLHVELLGGLTFVQAFSVEEEADIGDVEALTLAVGIHELLELSGILDLEKEYNPELKGALRLISDKMDEYYA